MARLRVTVTFTVDVQDTQAYDSTSVQEAADTLTRWYGERLMDITDLLDRAGDTVVIFTPVGPR